MNFSLFDSADAQEVIELFTHAFADSEGLAEGEIIGELVANMIASTPPESLIGCIATEGNGIVGCIFFSRFSVPSEQTAFILSPVAISTRSQGTGVGQKLINYGLDYLRTLNIDLVLTYGDPAFYSKTGFKKISEQLVKAPFTLTQPDGWLAQSLDGNAIQAMQGNTECVAALSDQKYW